MVPVAALFVGIALPLGHDQLDHLPVPFELVASLVIIGFVFWTVFVVLHHAEAIAHRVGEPFGTLVLTTAVTAIEASVIVSVMLHGTPNPTIARESVFSTVMIVCAGVIGLALLLGGWRHHHREHKRQGTSALLAVIMALSVLVLVLPNYTLRTGPGEFSPLQLMFISGLCLLLYIGFVIGQTQRYREDFLDAEAGSIGRHEASGSPVRSFVLLGIGLVGIVLMAEYVAATLETALEAAHVEQVGAIVGAFVATLVLLPETVAAIRAAMHNQLQRSLNIALGSACATIGMAVPIVALISLFTGHPLILGLGPGDTVLLLLALGVSIVSFGSGRTTVLTGVVHLVIFVAYVLLIAVP
ncbi:ionic transporter [Devosia sp. MSA67]|uniref:Ionic transporter n=2 Tax=Devosia sediminis TaxID=2798801 RepID=A0A934IUD2_9HYPH|nr:ionic transporter [Devosia sediminis]